MGQIIDLRIFWRSLCNMAFCSGFLEHFKPVSGLGGLYSQGEKGENEAQRSLQGRADVHNCHRTGAVSVTLARTRCTQGGMYGQGCLPRVYRGAYIPRVHLPPYPGSTMRLISSSLPWEAGRLSWQRLSSLPWEAGRLSWQRLLSP